MNVVIAIDSFKGSMTSLEAGEAAKEGVLRACPDALVTVRPMADGGEGTVDALVYAMDADVRTIEVEGPFGALVDCVYGLTKDGRTAVMEMSQASGITLVPRSELDPVRASTYGVGEMIRDALTRGCETIFIGIGGSATNDGGAGMLQALGFRLTDADGHEIRRGAAGLRDLCDIDPSGADPALKDCRIRVISDVRNPLTGPAGASAVFGPQKGATPDMVAELDGLLSKYADISKKIIPGADPDIPGSGAAGGLGFALRTFLGASLEPGIDIVLEVTKLEDYIRDADLVITGEGRIDRQTVMGKAPAGVAKLAAAHGHPALAFSGSVTEDAGVCNSHGISAFFPILRGVSTLEEAMETDTAKKNMAAAVEQAVRAFLAGREN